MEVIGIKGNLIPSQKEQILSLFGAMNSAHPTDGAKLSRDDPYSHSNWHALRCPAPSFSLQKRDSFSTTMTKPYQKPILLTALAACAGLSAPSQAADPASGTQRMPTVTS